MPYPGLLHPEPLLLWKSNADTNRALSQSLWGLWVLVHIRFVRALWASQAGIGFDSKWNFVPPTICWGFSFAFGCGAISSKLLQHSTAVTRAPTILLGLICVWRWGISSHSLQHHVAAAPVPYRKQYVNHELPDVQAGFKKSRGTRYQIASIHWIIKKVIELKKNSTLALLTMPKPLTVWITISCGKFWKPMTVWITIKCGKFWKRWEYQTTWPASWEIFMLIKKQVRTGHGTTHWFQIRKGLHQGFILSPCLFNLYAEYIMRNAGLEEA